ncbi:hypothetical protein TWF506_004377 [Arthrobotrys conoides]|uniref:BTB domain-containing protein n=1 Tax=Arthrobotrys conoides TaxID=74498 RepID=A0AAN8N0L3_9PEZI
MHGEVKEYYLHKAILCPNSTYFAEACKQLPNETVFQHMILPNIQPDSFEIAVRWIYGDKEIVKNNKKIAEYAYPVLDVAKLLDLEELRVVVTKEHLAARAAIAKTAKESGDVETFWVSYKRLAWQTQSRNIARESDNGFFAALIIERYNNILRSYPCCKCVGFTNVGNTLSSTIISKHLGFSHRKCNSAPIILDKELAEHLGV